MALLADRNNDGIYLYGIDPLRARTQSHRNIIAGPGTYHRDIVEHRMSLERQIEIVVVCALPA